MATYAVPRASANRVYGEAAFGLAAAELAVLDEHGLGGVVAGVERRALAGVDYLVVHCDGRELDAPALAVLGNLSALHAIFEVEGGLLRPLEAPVVRRHDDDVTTIQRYAGKTNEALTHLMVNLALAVTPTGFPRMLAGEPVRLLDPACGRGTTLNRAVVYGLDAVGLEHDKRDVEAYEAFLLGWLKDKRLKHEVQRARLRKGRTTPASRLTVTYGEGKDRTTHRTLEVVNDDTASLRDHVSARSVDLVVCDLPYGVQHGATAAPGTLRRSPEELLHVALPVWCDALRPGGGVALAWNLRTLSRARLVAEVEGAGLELCVPADDERFAHRVDRSIQRDVVVARRPGELSGPGSTNPGKPLVTVFQRHDLPARRALMNKAELVNAVAEKSGQTAAAVGSVLQAFEDVVTGAVASGEKVAMPGFLAFERADRAARTGRNPATGAEIQIAAATVPKVKIGKAFKDAVK